MSRIAKARVRGPAAVTAVVAALGGSLIAGAPAQADNYRPYASPEQPYGTVVNDSGVLERQYPSTDSREVGSLRSGARVGLSCKVRAQYIDGNTVWYLLRDRPHWVSARYVLNTGFVPYCKDVAHAWPADGLRHGTVGG
jgi:hypothetical protein